MEVAKYPIIGLNQDDDDATLQPGWCREIWNAIPRNGHSKTGRQNIKGTLVRTNASLPAGTNECIGAFGDKANNRIIYFIHNSNNNHGVWYFNPNANTHTKIIETQYLNFSLTYPIRSCSFIEDILQWSDDNNEPRSIIVSRAVAGTFYIIGSQAEFEKQCSLYKVPPLFPPTIPDTLFNTFRGRSVGTSGTNNITSDSYQFCTQYVYQDNCVSAISPISVLSKADTFPNTVTNTRNKITVTQAVESDLQAVIKTIRWIYIKNNDGNYWLFDETTATGAASYSIDFYNNDSAESIDPPLTSFIPNKSKNILIHDQRSIVTMNQYDYEDWTTGSISAVTVAIGAGSTSSNTICAPNASYTIGVVFYDKFGRTNGVVGTADVTMPNIKKPIGETILSNSDQLHITWSLTGTPPSWATSYSIVMKKCNTYDLFWRGFGFILFYIRDGAREAASEIEDNGKVFYETAQNGWNGQLYFKLPNNIPFALDSTFKMRLLNTITGASDLVDITGIVGDKIIIGNNMGVTAWATALGGSSGPYGMLSIALEKYNTEPDEIFYEIGQNYDCSGGSLTTTSGRVYGDYHYEASAKYSFDKLDLGDVKYGGTFGNYIEFGSGYTVTAPTISSSPTFSTVTLDDTKTSVEKVKGAKAKNTVKTGLKVLGAIGVIAAPFTAGASLAVTAAATGLSTASNFIKDAEERKVTEISTLRLSYSSDLTKSASDIGRPSVIVRNKQVNYEPTTLSISDKYVTNSNINNINQFRNLYTLPPNRTPVRKIVDVSSSNIFLAIHERTVTSLTTYAGGNVFHTTDNSQLIGDGSSVIPYERELVGGYGTIYPDSVVEHNGKVYFFDAYSGEVVRYSNAGLTPIGSVYKMKTFFREKGDQFVDTTDRNVIAGYDSNLDILYMTFRSSVEDEEVTVAFLDKQGEERWITFTDFLPERYAQLNDRLFGFVDGVMWEFNQSNTYNSFFGTIYSARIKHLFNTEFSKEKMLNFIAVESNKKWAFDPILVTKNDFEQETSLAESNFEQRDDVYYAEVKRDKNTAVGLLPAGKSALTAGNPLTGKVYEINLENSSISLTHLDAINYGYTNQSGHNV
jgi:hypothetical protein